MGCDYKKYELIRWSVDNEIELQKRRGLPFFMIMGNIPKYRILYHMHDAPNRQKPYALGGMIDGESVATDCFIDLDVMIFGKCNITGSEIHGVVKIDNSNIESSNIIGENLEIRNTFLSNATMTRVYDQFIRGKFIPPFRQDVYDCVAEENERIAKNFTEIDFSKVELF